jgi:hypothetical protein
MHETRASIYHSNERKAYVIEADLTRIRLGIHLRHKQIVADQVNQFQQ